LHLALRIGRVVRRRNAMTPDGTRLGQGVIMRRIGMVVQVAVGLCLTSVATLHGQDPSLGGVDPQPSVELPEELAQILRDYERHWSAGEADELSALFVERGLIVRGGTWIRGRDAIRQAYQSASGPLRLRAIKYAADGDVGYIVGAYGYGENPPVDDRGMFVLTLRRDSSGRWLIVSDLDRGAG
jgi:ketosteroid isomerase-like protein